MAGMILTLRLDHQSQTRFEALRQRYFPPERNVIAAHLTLFHQLPDSVETETAVSQAAAAVEPFPLHITGLRSLGRGVAYRMASPVLMALHAQLARVFAAELIPQDRQRFDPHVVVQNKVESKTARALLAELTASFVPETATAEGLELWHYLGGPWEHAATFLFGQSARPPAT